MSSAPVAVDGAAARPARFSSYQRRLFAFLSVACFFEGYDFFALSQLLPNLRAYFGLSPAEGTTLVGVVNAGTVFAYLMVGAADRWGRRRVLSVTILGYALCTLLSALAPSAVIFTFVQFLARIFLIGEWATSMVIAAEEYPASRRGMVIGVVSAVTGLGSIVCAAVVPALLRTPWGWRSVYAVGVTPLILMAYARRGLRETERFRTLSSPPAGIAKIWRTKHARRVVELGAIWLLCYVCTQSAVMFWKEFAVSERGLSDSDVGRAVAVSALVALPFAFFAGHFLDAVGRRLGGTVILGLLAGGVFLGYTAKSALVLTLALTAATIGINCTLTLLNTLTTELFPTEQRGAAFAWSNNLIGRIGYWASPFVMGRWVATYGWGRVVRCTALFPLLALLLVWWLLPETRGLELEQSSESAI
jgi:putative MFS transporter